MIYLDQEHFTFCIQDFAIYSPSLYPSPLARNRKKRILQSWNLALWHIHTFVCHIKALKISQRLDNKQQSSLRKTFYKCCGFREYRLYICLEGSQKKEQLGFWICPSCVLPISALMLYLIPFFRISSFNLICWV